ncbi:MAG: urease accessory UreF family protein [Solirubrobacteraceae bacterium]
MLELLLADARTPTGGYAHSGGLEAAGLESSSEVLPFIRARLLTVGRVEAAFAAAAWRAASVNELLELDVEWAARTLAEPLRRASKQLGRGLLRTAVQWFPDSWILRSYFGTSELTPRPVALGAVAAAGGLLPVAAARASLYDDATTVAAAAVKLLPLDAAVSSGWVLSLADEIDSLAFEAAAAAASGGASSCFDSWFASLPSTATPLLDRRAMTHASTDRRLFAS